jgi:hypothetical protein
MITKFKIFEGAYPEYAKTAKKGDIVVCIRQPNEHDSKEMHRDIIKGDKYEILSVDKPKPDDDVQYYYFKLKNLRTNDIITGYGAVLFKPEHEYDANKFNL